MLSECLPDRLPDGLPHCKITSRSPSGITDRLPDRLCSQVEITMPDPKDHPDAYDAKGNLVDMYKDPDMMLGFAERVRCFPDPG